MKRLGYSIIGVFACVGMIQAADTYKLSPFTGKLDNVGEKATYDGYSHTIRDNNNAFKAYTAIDRAVRNQQNTFKGISTTGLTAIASPTSANAIYGKSVSGEGVYGESSSRYGVHGVSSPTGSGVYGYSSTGYGVEGGSASGYGGKFSEILSVKLDGSTSAGGSLELQSTSNATKGFIYFDGTRHLNFYDAAISYWNFIKSLATTAVNYVVKVGNYVRNESATALIGFDSYDSNKAPFTGAYMGAVFKVHSAATPPKRSQLVFGTMTSGTLNQWMVLSGRGYLGLGTTTPQQNLQVNGTASFGNLSSLTNNRIILDSDKLTIKSNSVESSSYYLFKAMNGAKARTTLDNNGVQQWFIKNGAAGTEVGKIAYSIPGGDIAAAFFRYSSNGNPTTTTRWDITVNGRNSSNTGSANPMLTINRNGYFPALVNAGTSSQYWGILASNLDALRTWHVEGSASFGNYSGVAANKKTDIDANGRLKVVNRQPNFAMLDAALGLRFKGTAIQYDDVTISLANIKAPASASPTWTAYKGSQVPAFSASATNTLYWSLQLPHGYSEGSAIGCHIHVAYPDNTTGNSRWTMTTSWANVDGTFPTETTETLTFAAPAVADAHKIHSFSSIAGTSKTISSMLIGSISRIGGDAADTYAGVIYGVSLDCHIQKDSIGSDNATSKSATPN